jgi:hypothetical protein
MIKRKNLKLINHTFGRTIGENLKESKYDFIVGIKIE